MEGEWHQIEDLDIENISLPVSDKKDIMPVVSVESNIEIE